MLLTKWVFWPELQTELSEHINFLFGNVLNAGCGTRPIHIPNAKRVTNLDIMNNNNVDVVADLENIPFNDATFDSILNIAVLEHCRRPWVIIGEFNRVLKPNGRIICVVPFLQPVHMHPTDYFRVTEDGLKSIFNDQGFDIKLIKKTHSIFHVLGWFMEEIMSNTVIIFQILLFPIAKVNYYLSKYYSNCKINTIYSAVTVLATKR
ncbi:MAG: class I SAM-dependent methyltransferase [bacterium]|nr:class I SAM-dependent methyltransferase [bacterium]